MKQWLIIFLCSALVYSSVAFAKNNSELSVDTSVEQNASLKNDNLPSTLLPLNADVTTPEAEDNTSSVIKETNTASKDDTSSDLPKQPDTKKAAKKKRQSAHVAVLPSTLQPLQGHVDVVDAAIKKGSRSIDVPAETVMQVSLTEGLNTNHSTVGDAVTATVKDPVFIGPYQAVPAGSTLEGTVSGINKRGIKQGPNPYILVDFTQLKRAGETETVPINAQLIAYKTGLKKEDYLWKLPRKTNAFKKHMGNAAQGALVGLLANPLFGPVIGAGAGVAMGMTVDKVAQRSSIRIKPGEVIPIAVQDSFKVTVATDISKPD
jgi:hypothetical protein